MVIGLLKLMCLSSKGIGTIIFKLTYFLCTSVLMLYIWIFIFVNMSLHSFNHVSVWQIGRSMCHPSVNSFISIFYLPLSLRTKCHPIGVLCCPFIAWNAYISLLSPCSHILLILDWVSITKSYTLIITWSLTASVCVSKHFQETHVSYALKV